MADCGMSLDKFADAMAALPPVRERVKAEAIEAQGVPYGLREFVQRVAKQKPEKPDYWSACGQCERNISDAEDLIASAPPAPQAEPAPAGSGGWEAHAKALEHELAYWKQRAQTMHEHQKGECWYWQGDGNDHPESMVNSLPVVIRADALRALMAPQASVVQQEPVAGQCRFVDESEWKSCSVAHAQMIQSFPNEWRDYEVRLLYTHPAPQEKPIGWLYDWTHSSALGKPDEHFTSFTTDEEHARKNSNARPVFDAAQQAKPKPLSDEQIIRDGLLTTPLAVLHNIGDTFKAGARFAEAAHGIQGSAA